MFHFDKNDKTEKNIKKFDEEIKQIKEKKIHKLNIIANRNRDKTLENLESLRHKEIKKLRYNHVVRGKETFNIFGIVTLIVALSISFLVFLIYDTQKPDTNVNVPLGFVSNQEPTNDNKDIEDHKPVDDIVIKEEEKPKETETKNEPTTKKSENPKDAVKPKESKPEKTTSDNSGKKKQEASKPVETKDTNTQSKENSDSYTVYITKSGTKYHADGCRHLSKSKIKSTVKEAKANNLAPCSKCNPPH